MPPSIDLDATRAAFYNNEIYSWSNSDLERASCELATSHMPNEQYQRQQIIMADAIHNILLKRLLDGQEERNRRTQFWFMVLAISALAAAITQIIVAIVK